MSSEEQKQTYRITGNNIRFSGKIHRIGRKIDLADEDARRLKEFLEPIEEDTADDSLTDQLLQERDNTIESLTDQLLQERDNTIESLNNQLAQRESDLDELTIELNQLRETNELLKSENAGLVSQNTGLRSQITTLEAAPAKTPAPKKQGGNKP